MLFLRVMWTATVVSFLTGILVDDVITIFKVFGASLGVSAVVRFRTLSYVSLRAPPGFWNIPDVCIFFSFLQLCLPSWPMYNKNPIKFVVETDASETTSIKTD